MLLRLSFLYPILLSSVSLCPPALIACLRLCLSSCSPLLCLFISSHASFSQTAFRLFSSNPSPLHFFSLLSLLPLCTTSLEPPVTLLPKPGAQSPRNSTAPSVAARTSSRAPPSNPAPTRTSQYASPSPVLDRRASNGHEHEGGASSVPCRLPHREEARNRAASPAIPARPTSPRQRRRSISPPPTASAIVAQARASDNKHTQGQGEQLQSQTHVGRRRATSPSPSALRAPSPQVPRTAAAAAAGDKAALAALASRPPPAVPGTAARGRAPAPPPLSLSDSRSGSAGLPDRPPSPQKPYVPSSPSGSPGTPRQHKAGRTAATGGGGTTLRDSPSPRPERPPGPRTPYSPTSTATSPSTIRPASGGVKLRQTQSGMQQGGAEAAGSNSTSSSSNKNHHRNSLLEDGRHQMHRRTHRVKSSVQHATADRLARPLSTGGKHGPGSSRDGSPISPVSPSSGRGRGSHGATSRVRSREGSTGRRRTGGGGGTRPAVPPRRASRDKNLSLARMRKEDVPASATQPRPPPLGVHTLRQRQSDLAGAAAAALVSRKPASPTIAPRPISQHKAQQSASGADERPVSSIDRTATSTAAATLNAARPRLHTDGGAQRTVQSSSGAARAIPVSRPPVAARRSSTEISQQVALAAAAAKQQATAAKHAAHASPPKDKPAVTDKPAVAPKPSGAVKPSAAQALGRHVSAPTPRARTRSGGVITLKPPPPPAAKPGLSAGDTGRTGAPSGDQPAAEQVLPLPVPMPIPPKQSSTSASQHTHRLSLAQAGGTASDELQPPPVVRRSSNISIESGRSRVESFFTDLARQIAVSVCG